MESLGLIEVNGYLAAIGAADSALKAANVSLISIEKVKAAICTVEITGEVGAVKAAVEAGARAADSLGLLRSISVIPRLHEETLKILSLEKEVKTLENERSTDELDKIISENNNVIEEITDDTKEEVIKEAIKDKELEIEPQETVEEVNSIEDDYNSIKVEELRRMVRSLNLPNISNKFIKFSKKDELIKILLDNKKEGDK